MENEGAKVIQMLPDLEGKDLMVGNIVLYEDKKYILGCVTDSILFLIPINGASGNDPQIKCFLYQAKSMPLAAETLDQLPFPVNDVPSWINCVHELQNWYYWNNGKKKLELKF